MLEPFQLPFVQHGIVEVLILAVAGGLIGTWIVLRGLAFYAHATAEADRAAADHFEAVLKR
jgi:ABC-type Mn2+/Zn2+ transport system permease subunit